MKRCLRKEKKTVTKQSTASNDDTISELNVNDLVLISCKFFVGWYLDTYISGRGIKYVSTTCCYVLTVFLKLVVARLISARLYSVNLS